MTIKIYEQFAPFANPADGDYPYGSIKNDSIPGAEDGTPLDAVWANDYAGFDAALLAEAGIVPSGVADKLGASQRVDAIKKLGVVNADYQFTTAIPAKFSGWPQLEPPYIATMKSEKYCSIDSDSMTLKNRAMKAWKQPKGIKDGAVAGSFILTNSNVEPVTQVIGFGNFEDVGTYIGRDAVALYAQVDSAAATVSSTNVIFASSQITLLDDGDYDLVEVGMIADVNYGLPGWVGSVVIGKEAPNVLLISPWVQINGTSAPAATPVSGTLNINRHSNIWAANFNALTSNSGGANQAIGIETGLSCAGTGTGTNSKAYYAVNLGGEDPEYAFVTRGKFQKSYTSKDSNVYGFKSENDLESFISLDSRGNSYYSKNPDGNHIECKSGTNLSHFMVRNDGKVAIGTNPEASTARLNLRGEGYFNQVYDQTEFQIYDPTTGQFDKQGFFITQNFPASAPLGTFTIGVGHTGAHEYGLAISVAGGNKMFFNKNGNVEAGVDNTQSLGVAGKRWAEIFAGNGVINTSDERLKTFRGSFSEKEKAVARKIKSLLTSYYWNESLEREKSGGGEARIHVGIGAQSLAKVFEDEGLDPRDYAMFCFDEWDETITKVQVNVGEKIKLVKKEKIQRTRKVTKHVPVTVIDLIDGKYVETVSIKSQEIDELVFETHPVYTQSGELKYRTEKTNNGVVKTQVFHSVPVYDDVETIEYVNAEPIYEDVIEPAGNRYGVRLDQVLVFVIANT